MTNGTKQLVFQKEYRRLLSEQEKAGEELRWFLVKKFWNAWRGNALRDIVQLKLKGGPKNLSAKFDFYLYNR